MPKIGISNRVVDSYMDLYCFTGVQGGNAKCAIPGIVPVNSWHCTCKFLALYLQIPGEKRVTSANIFLVVFPPRHLLRHLSVQVRLVLQHSPRRTATADCQCCVTGAGTATFCLSGSGTVMNSGFESGFRPGSNIKCNTEVKKSKIRGQLFGKQCCF
jgi:hypothetical protein